MFEYVSDFDIDELIILDCARERAKYDAEKELEEVRIAMQDDSWWDWN